jgi:hypothetical protein
MPEVSIDPPQVVSDFIASLPVTIKDTVLMLVWVYVVRLYIRRGANLESEINDLLQRSGRTFGFGMLLCTVAAIDHILSTSVSNAEAREETLRDIAQTDPSFQQAALQAPLNKRHFDAAWHRWSVLRTDALAPEKLQDFERRLRTTPPRK